MKRSLLILGVLFCFSTAAWSQGGVVSAPILESQVATLNATQLEQSTVITSMNGVVAALEKAEHEYKEAMKKATWIRNLQTAQRLLVLVESVVCTTKDINVRFGMAESNCLYSFKYDVSIVKISMAADFLSLLLANGVSMSAGERMMNLSNVISAFENAQEELAGLNKELDSDLRKQSRQEIADARITARMSMTRSGKKAFNPR